MLLTCTAAVSLSGGCRSVPGMNMFSFRSKPSAEALAGAGPTTTYPAPPSDSSTPEAIASIAGGTGGPDVKPETTQVAGIDVSPGYATPAANLAAAQANGIYSGAAPAGYDRAGAPQGTPSGYTFGSNAFTPKTPAASPPDSSAYSLAASGAANSSGVTAPSTSITPPSTGYMPPSTGYAPPSTGYAPPSTAFAPPPMNNYTAPPSSPGSSGGFDLPTDPPSLAADSTPGISFPASQTVTPSTTTESESSAAAPSFSTASVAPTITAPSTTSSSSSISGGSSFSGGGYSPGSTGTSQAYPLGNETPTTNGSIFR